VKVRYPEVAKTANRLFAICASGGTPRSDILTQLRPTIVECDQHDCAIGLIVLLSELLLCELESL